MRVSRSQDTAKEQMPATTPMKWLGFDDRQSGTLIPLNSIMDYE